MSAIAEEPENGSFEVLKVLFALYPGVDALDFTGPLEVFSLAQHNPRDKATKGFTCTFAAATEYIEARQGCTFKSEIDFKEAHKRLKEFDVLVVPGGSTADILKSSAEPIPLIKAFADIQARDPSRERTLFSVCTGALLLAQAGVLQGMAATTHPDCYIQLEKLCQEASARVSANRTDVMEERYVVNNARFDLGDLDENPYVVDRREQILSHKDRRRSSVARKGSSSLRQSNTARESNVRRAAMRLGGLRVVTSGAVTSGIDASLYLVCALVSVESAEEVVRTIAYNWVKGVVVDAIDV